MSNRGAWKSDVYVLDGSAVGGICKTAGGNWESFGCMDEWQDTPLAVSLLKSHAKKEVEYWVGEHLKREAKQ